ncbi:MAG: RES family NAD+ phosphorylase [Candidatus Eremiobacteraeota bacterium]|nr:RES family NAD+ phosphorylase [Candidatus Eremiobacteraeota bacterium]
MKLYRAFPCDPTAAERDPGGSLFVPNGGAGRIDNPDLYRVLYASTHAAGAVAETFGRFPYWDDETFVHANGNRYALAEYDVPNGLALFNMNDVAGLQELGLVPTEVIVRDRKVTQRWAREIYAKKAWSGIQWWSYYCSLWVCYGFWEYAGITTVVTTALTTRHPAVIEAAHEIVRVVS